MGDGELEELLRNIDEDYYLEISDKRLRTRKERAANGADRG